MSKIRFLLSCVFIWGRKQTIKKPDSNALIRELKLGHMIGSEKAMAPHSSTLAWKIPWTEDPDRLLSTGSLSVRQD